MGVRWLLPLVILILWQAYIKSLLCKSLYSCMRKLQCFEVVKIFDHMLFLAAIQLNNITWRKLLGLFLSALFISLVSTPYNSATSLSRMTCVSLMTMILLSVFTIIILPCFLASPSFSSYQAKPCVTFQACHPTSCR